MSKNRVFAVIVLLVAVVVLVLASSLVDFNRIFINGLGGSMNDQIGYISVGRHLAESGMMRSSVIYPSTLAQPTTKNYFYMPGHYLSMAASFRVFGYTVMTALLPSAVAFVSSALLVYFVGWRLFGAWSGLVASILFVTFPVNVILAWSAMSEMTLTAAVLVALALFVVLPDRWKPILGPILVAIPLLFRETGAIVAVPMFFLILQKKDDTSSGVRWRRAGLFAILTAVSVLFVLNSSVARGRPTLFLNNIAGNMFTQIYTDAYSMENVDRSPANLRRLIAAKSRTNLEQLVRYLAPAGVHDEPSSGERFAMWFLLAGIPFAIVAAFWRKDLFSAGIALAVMAVIGLILLTYTVWVYRGVRVLLLLQPLVCLVYGSIIASFIEQRRWVPVSLATLLVCVFAWMGTGYVRKVYEPQDRLNRVDDEAERFVETLGIDDRKMVVAQHDIILRYLINHHPVQWSFIPANRATFQLLKKRYAIGTVIYPVTPYAPSVSLEDLEKEGFPVVGKTTHKGQEMLILRPR